MNRSSTSLHDGALSLGARRGAARKLHRRPHLHCRPPPALLLVRTCLRRRGGWKVEKKEKVEARALSRLSSAAWNGTLYNKSRFARYLARISPGAIIKVVRPSNTTGCPPGPGHRAASGVCAVAARVKHAIETETSAPPVRRARAPIDCQVIFYNRKFGTRLARTGTNTGTPRREKESEISRISRISRGAHKVNQTLAG